MAVNSGYEGTYEEWLESIKGASIVLQINDGYIQITSQNRFLTGDSDIKRFALQEIKEENGDFTLKDIYETNFQGFESFFGNIFLDEKTFITLAEDKYSPENDYQSPSYIVVFKCE